VLAQGADLQRRHAGSHSAATWRSS
jgi:hypothetical protein